MTHAPRSTARGHRNHSGLLMIALACLAAASLAPMAFAQPESITLANAAYVRAATAASLSPQQFTIETWFRGDGPGYGFANDGFGAALVNKPSEGAVGDSLTSWGLFWSSSTQKVFAHITHQLFVQGTYLQSTASIPMGTLAHVAMTFDGTTLRLYINGQLDSQVATPTSVVYYSTSMPVLIGACNFGAGYSRSFQGLIDEVRIWDHARTPAEIASIPSCQHTGPQVGLLAAWEFDGATLTDSSGHGLTATSSGDGFSYVPQPAAVHTSCRADFNCSGSVSVGDIFDFLAAWFAGNPAADFNGLSGVSIQDIFDFLGAWFVGC